MGNSLMVSAIVVYELPKDLAIYNALTTTHNYAARICLNTKCRPTTLKLMPTHKGVLAIVRDKLFVKDGKYNVRVLVPEKIVVKPEFCVKVPVDKDKIDYVCYDNLAYARANATSEEDIALKLNIVNFTGERATNTIVVGKEPLWYPGKYIRKYILKE